MVAIIIWGSTGKTKQVGTGEFYCPNCRHSTPYTRMRASRYFTLYFIPLFPMGKLGEWVICNHCNNEFDDLVTEMSPHEIETAMAPWKCGECGNQNPAGETRCVGCGAPRASAN